MKKIIYALCFAIAIQGCQPEVNYKTVRQEVIVLHDDLMANEDKLMNVKMSLDTLALTGLAKIKAQHAGYDTAAVHAQITILTTKLDSLSNQMSKWMEHFRSDVEGKSNAEAVAYFEQEKVKVKKLDSLYKVTLSESETYLKKFDIRPDTAKHHEHSMHM